MLVNSYAVFEKFFNDNTAYHYVGSLGYLTSALRLNRHYVAGQACEVTYAGGYDEDFTEELNAGLIIQQLEEAPEGAELTISYENPNGWSEYGLAIKTATGKWRVFDEEIAIYEVYNGEDMLARRRKREEQARKRRRIEKRRAKGFTPHTAKLGDVARITGTINVAS